MATMTIREYEHLCAVPGGPLPVGKEPAIAVQRVNITGGSLQSAPFQERTHFVRLHVDTSAGFDMGLNPTALAFQDFAAGQTEYFGTEPGHRVAVIAA